MSAVFNPDLPTITIPLSLEELKQTKLQKIKTHMQVLKFSPIAYDGKLLDADEMAILNINGKLREIEASLALNLPVENLVWRDADDEDHSWETVEAYHIWLQGLVIAISARGTLLYGISWHKQAELTALTDLADVQDYDVMQGWP